MKILVTVCVSLTSFVADFVFFLLLTSRLQLPAHPFFSEHKDLVRTVFAVHIYSLGFWHAHSVFDGNPALYSY
jgi:hypothetical protein